MNDISTATSGSALLHDVRVRLLHLHQTLLEIERKSFERTHGRVNSGELLQLVINHAQFAWLRMVSALVVQIDEMLDADEPVTDADVINLITGLANFLRQLTIKNSATSTRQRCSRSRKL